LEGESRKSVRVGNAVMGALFMEGVRSGMTGGGPRRGDLLMKLDEEEEGAVEL